jgi:hypothetical protein
MVGGRRGKDDRKYIGPVSIFFWDVSNRKALIEDDRKPELLRGFSNLHQRAFFPQILMDYSPQASE